MSDVITPLLLVVSLAAALYVAFWDYTHPQRHIWWVIRGRLARTHWRWTTYADRTCTHVVPELGRCHDRRPDGHCSGCEPTRTDVDGRTVYVHHTSKEYA